MKPNKIIKLVAAALMAAMTCVATVVIPVPSPAGGYVNLGDGFVILSGIILGPFFGGLAAGIGSMLADLLLGFSGYAAATLIIKGLAAIAACFIFRSLYKNKSRRVMPVLFAGIAGGFIVTSGYFIFEGTLLGLGFASASVNIPPNLIQNVLGIIVSVLLFPLLRKVPQIRSLMEEK